MNIKSIRTIVLVLVLLLVVSCRAEHQNQENTPDYPVTVIPPAASASATPTFAPLPPDTSEPLYTPTIDWSQVTLLPLQTPEVEETQESPQEPTSPEIPDPLTEANVDLLAPGQIPFELGDAEISLGRMLLPIDLLGIDDPFSIWSIPVENYPDWLFLAFELPLPSTGELGALVHAPFSGEVLAGSMQMLNEETVSTVSIDHALRDDQLVRATFVYSGTVEPLFTMGQPVQAGDILFRLTRDTGRVSTLGTTPIPDGATLTLHISIDTVVQQESGVQSLSFLRGVSATPSGFLRDQDGLIISLQSN